MADDHVKDRLRKLYKSDEQGVWRIVGEDPNCDLAGYHTQPELITVIGTYINVGKYALKLQSFYTWGAGGNIIKTDLLNVDHIAYKDERIAQLEKEEAQLLVQVNEIRIKKEFLKK